MGKILILLLLLSTPLRAQTAADLFDTSLRKNGDKGLSQSSYSRSDSVWVAGAKSLTYTGSYALPTASPTIKGGILIGNRLYASPTGELSAVPNLSAYTNDVNYWTATQVRQAIADSNAARVIYFSGDFVGSGTPTDPFRLVTAPGTALTVDPVATQNSTNAASSGDLWSAKLGFAAKTHTHVSSDISDLNTAITNYLKALPGFGIDKVLSYNGTNLLWVAATPNPGSTTALTGSTLSSPAQLYTQITLNWTAVPNAFNYTLSQAQDAAFTVGVSNLYTGNSTAYTHTGLTGQSTYYYRLTPNGTGGYTNGPPAYLTVSTLATPSSLSAPALTLSGVSSSSLTATWTAVPNASGYELSNALDADFTNNATISYSGPALTYNQAGMVAATPYYYRLKALGTGNYTDSPFTSATATTTASPVSQTQLAGTTLSFSGVSSTVVTVSWAAVPNAGGYQVQRATDNGFTANVTIVYNGTALTVTNAGLSPSTPYYYRIKATGTGNYTDGAFSAAAPVTTTGSLLLGTPTLSLNGAASTQITTVWTSVTNASGYTLQQATNAGFTAGITMVYSGTATTFTQTGLTPQTAYYYRVGANGNGTYANGAATAVLSATTTAQAAGTYAVDRTIRVNLTSAANIAPVTGWNVWAAPQLAQITPATSTTGGINLLSETGVSSGISATVFSGTLSGANINAYGSLANAANLVWPAQVMQRGWNFSSSTNTPAVIRLSGLNPAKFYQLYLESGGPANATVYMLTFATGSLSRYVNASGNGGDNINDEFDDPALARFFNLQSDVNGNLDFSVVRPCCQNTTFQGFILQETSTTK